jgi:hypothetical protein
MIAQRDPGELEILVSARGVLKGGHGVVVGLGVEPVDPTAERSKGLVVGGVNATDPRALLRR